MHQSRTFRVALIVLASAVVASPVFADAAALRLRPEQGTTYRYVMTQRQDMTMAMGALGNQESTNTTTMDIRQTAREVVASGEVTFDVVYDRVRMDVQAGPRSMTFDSASETGNTADEMVGLLVGKQLSMTLTERGEVVRVEGLTAVLDEALAEQATDPAAAPLIEMMRGSFNDESMAVMFQQNSAILPEGPVREGSTWTHSSVVDNPAIGAMQVTQDYVIAGFEDKLGRPCVRADVKMVMTHEGDVPMVAEMKKMFSQGGQEVDMSVEIGQSDGAGSVWLDRETGMTVAMDTDSTMNMSIGVVMPGMPAEAGGGAMKMDMAMTMNQTLELQTETAPATE